MKHVIKTVLLSAALLASSLPTFGALQLRISDGTPAGTITVTDGDLNDFNLAPGFVGYSGPVGTNWEATLSQGISKPAVGSAAVPQLDIFTLDSSSYAAGVLTVELTDTDFTGAGPVFASYGGNTDGTVEYKSYSDVGNAEFGKTSTVTTLGPSVTGHFSGNAIGAVAPPGGPYSISLEVTITHPLPGRSTVDADFNLTPCDCILICSPNKTNECGQGSIDFDPPTTTGACGPVTILNTVTNKGCGNTFTATRTWQVIDSCGNTNTCSQTIATVDTTKPTITCSANKTVECSDNWTFDPPTASDNCGRVDVTIVSTTTNGSGCSYTVVRKWRATDECGNKRDCTQTVTVKDTTPPVITFVPSGGEIGCTNPPTVATITSKVTTTDNCRPVTLIVTFVDSGTACSSNRVFSIRATDGCTTSAVRTVTYTMNCAPCVPATINFQGSSALDGPDGNIRVFTTNGLSVKVSAFSRIKSSGVWNTAYLGQYGGGLGVTDSSEGDGSNNRHTVDNIDRNNYVLFEFSQPVILNRAFLGYVVTDSDLTLWIGNFTDPYNNHLTLSDATLGSFGFTEENLTDLSTTRWADLNSGEVVGNAIVIAALSSDTTPEDQFKIALMDLCKRECVPPPPPCFASICGSVLRDCDANGNVSGEAGLAGWTVKLKQGNTTVATTTTGASGNYCFTNLAAGTYTVVVTPMADYNVTSPANCNHQQTVTVAACQSKSGINFGYTGTKPAVNIVVTGPANAKCGDTIKYVFCVTNTGNTCVYGGLIVNSPLLGGQIFHRTPVNPGQGFCFTNSYTVKSSDPNPLVNTATVIGDPPGNLANVSKTVSVSTAITCPSSQPPPAPNYLTATPGCNLVNLSWQASSGATSYNVKRSTTKGGPYTTIKTGVTGTSYTDNASVVNGVVYYYVVTAVKSGAESGNSNEASAIPFNALPSPFNSKDIGAVGATGGASFSGNKFTVVGSGADIWNTSDEFHYVYQQASGDCTIVARVASVQNTDPWAKAGIMVRETLAADSKHASMLVTPGNGLSIIGRFTTGASSVSGNIAGVTAPYWVKIERVSNTFKGYYSSNGVNWTLVGSQTLPMTTSVYIGLAISSHNDGVLNTATFDNVTATP